MWRARLANGGPNAVRFSASGLSTMRLLLPIVYFALAVVPGRAGDVPDPLQELLNGPASLLVTPHERELLKRLKSDQEKEEFLENFWKVRDPNPSTPENEFKEEFYKRVTYANAFFGADAGTDGWRTDRGRTYILFGPPKSKTSFIGHQDLYPIELWFYDNPGIKELPAFFYVLFFAPDDASGFRLYHPYVHGPERLVRNSMTKAQAYYYLQRINAELARASLSLIPGEPVDTETFTGSLSSTVVLDAVRGFNNLPSYQTFIDNRWATFEKVSARIQYHLPDTELFTFVAHLDGEPWLHWQLLIQEPGAKKIQNGLLEFRITTRLLAHDRVIFERVDHPRLRIPAEQVEDLEKRPFGYEDWLPVAPGDYTLEVVAENLASGKTYSKTRDVHVGGASSRVNLGDVFIIGDRKPEPRLRAFSFGGYRFQPALHDSVNPARGLPIFYEVFLPAEVREPVEVEYVVGSVSQRVRKVSSEKLEVSNRDLYGYMKVVRTLDIREFSPGSYLLAIRVKDPVSGQVSGRTVSFRIGAQEGLLQPVIISRASSGDQRWRASTYYERALCYLEQKELQRAIKFLELANRTYPTKQVSDLLNHLKASASGLPPGSTSIR